MDQKALIDGLIFMLCFIPIVTFHEFAHAWVAWKLGDDTAYREGRVTLNPQSHIDLLGTLIVPGIAVAMMASGGPGFIFGWGKPVPVNLNNLQNVRRDDNLISLAGPAMNVLLAFIAMIIAKIALVAGVESVQEAAFRLAQLSLFLCFFNLLPIPPLDGSHVLKNIIGMSHETYANLAQYGIIMVIVAIQIPAVSKFLVVSTYGTLAAMMKVLGLM